jgi:hypothetical protein
LPVKPPGTPASGVKLSIPVELVTSTAALFAGEPGMFATAATIVKI